MVRSSLKTRVIAFFIILALAFSAGCQSNLSHFPPTTQNPIPTNPTPTPPTSITVPPTTPTTVLGSLSVHYIDVGQGDAILIDLGTTEVLIDGGNKASGVVSYLQRYVDGDLEAVVATHPHADHIGGLIAVLDSFKVDDIWLNGETSTTATYQEFTGMVNSEGAQVHRAVRGDTISVGSLSFIVLSPMPPLGNDPNENSIVLRLIYGTDAFLFMGDAGITTESSIMAAGLTIQAQFLKVGHHGSSSASSPAFLNVVRPETAIYSAGAGNSYGHPHQATIESLTQWGATIYGTDNYGTVTVTIDGITCNIQTSKTPGSLTPLTIPPTIPSTSAPPAGSTSQAGNIKITKIFYDGFVANVESDEYVEITNLGTAPVDLKGWVLRDISEGYPAFTFPNFILQPGQKIRVYTNQIHPEYGGFSFGYGNAVWNNSNPDVAALYDAQGREVCRLSY